MGTASVCALGRCRNIKILVAVGNEAPSALMTYIATKEYFEITNLVSSALSAAAKGAQAALVQYLVEKGQVCFGALAPTPAVWGACADPWCLWLCVWLCVRACVGCLCV